MSEEKNDGFDEAAKRDLEKREQESGLFEQEKENAKKQEHLDTEPTVTSLGKSSDWQKKNKDSGEEYKLGWHNISVANFPSGGLFYPEDIKVSIRPASVKEIRQFSVVNDDDPFSIDEGMNHIMGSCVNVNIKGKISNWKDILEEDRIHVVLSVRELTFSKGENNLHIPFECEECGNEGKMEFNNKNLRPTKPKDDIMKYFDHNAKSFNVRTKSSGNFDIKPPTIGVMKVISDWIQEQTATPAARKRLDQGFVKVLPYLVHDWRGFNKQKIKDIQIEFMGWDAKKYSTFFHVVDLIKVGVDAEVHDLCTSCGGEVHAPIMFPNGVKSLFIVSDLAGELL